MSETQTRKGIVKLVANSLKEFMSSKGYNVNKNDLLNEFYQEGFDSSYVYINDKIYEIKEEHNINYKNIYQATELPNGDIKFLVQYYDGSMGLDEAIGKAINNIIS
jgi:hypothetical protein